MDNTQQIIADMKGGTARKLVQSRIDEVMQNYTDILTGDANDTVITKQYNDAVYTKYDLVRIARKMLKDVKDIPDWLINQHTPTKILEQYE